MLKSCGPSVEVMCSTEGVCVELRGTQFKPEFESVKFILVVTKD